MAFVPQKNSNTNWLTTSFACLSGMIGGNVEKDGDHIWGTTARFGLSFLVILLAWIWWMRTVREKRLKNFPPGPRSSLEFLVTFRHFMRSSNVKFLPAAEEYERDYGKIMGISTSLFRGVVLSNFADLKEAYNNPAVTARPPPMTQMFQMFSGGHRGLASSSGRTWKDVRRFTVCQLKSYGVGQKTLEPMIIKDVEAAVSLLRTKVDRPFSAKHFFNISAFNVLWQLIAGQRFQYTDPVALNLLHGIERTLVSWISFALLVALPRLFTWPLTFLGRNPFLQSTNDFLHFTTTFVKHRLENNNNVNSTVNNNNNDNDKVSEYLQDKHEDFTNSFLEKIRSTSDVTSPFYGEVGYENLAETIRDLFVAGTETTGATMAWILLYLAINPEKQGKLQKEIDQVLGQRLPALDDRSRMKYTEAVILETLRKSSNSPILIPHYTTQEVTIGHYTIPKDTTVVGNAYAIHHNKETWGDPYVFRPERFLSEDESSLVKYEELIAFGVGKRMCPGEALAKQQLFLFVTHIFREFSVTWNPEETKPDIEQADIGLTMMPIAHTLIITKRRIKYD